MRTADLTVQDFALEPALGFMINGADGGSSDIDCGNGSPNGRMSGLPQRARDLFEGVRLVASAVERQGKDSVNVLDSGA